jgi:steroid 5-alpha reductase family enzyme
VFLPGAQLADLGAPPAGVAFFFWVVLAVAAVAAAVAVPLLSAMTKSSSTMSTSWPSSTVLITETEATLLEASAESASSPAIFLQEMPFPKQAVLVREEDKRRKGE